MFDLTRSFFTSLNQDMAMALWASQARARVMSLSSTRVSAVIHSEKTTMLFGSFLRELSRRLLRARNLILLVSARPNARVPHHSTLTSSM